MNYVTSISISFQVPGFHNWPDAPAAYSYLRKSHRHVFHVYVHVRVDGLDREIEMIEFKEIAKRAFEALNNGMVFGHLNFGSNSCEQLAFMLVCRLQTSYNITSVGVFEDDENGAWVDVSN